MVVLMIGYVGDRAPRATPFTPSLMAASERTLSSQQLPRWSSALTLALVRRPYNPRMDYVSNAPAFKSATA
jgi:hypothetical protein